MTKKILGYPYSIFGVVIKGKGWGTKFLDMPTANILLKHLPPLTYGIYLTQVSFDKKYYWGIMYFGVSPSVSKNLPPTIEVHLIDTSQNLYGKKITVSIRQFISKELSLPTIEKLKQKMHQDLAIAKKLCESITFWKSPYE